MLCSIRGRAQLDVNACFLIVGRNSWNDFILYFSVLALTEAIRDSHLEIWIILTASYFSMSELLEVVYWLIDHMTNLLSDIRRNGFLFHKRV